MFYAAWHPSHCCRQLSLLITFVYNKTGSPLPSLDRSTIHPFLREDPSHRITRKLEILRIPQCKNTKRPTQRQIDGKCVFTSEVKKNQNQIKINSQNRSVLPSIIIIQRTETALATLLFRSPERELLQPTIHVLITAAIPIQRKLKHTAELYDDNCCDQPAALYS